MTENRLREWREREGLSMQALAERIGTSAPQINKLEKGERRLTLDWMTRLAAGLGCEPRDLMPEGEPPRRLPGGEAALGPAPHPIDPRDLIPVRSAARGGSEQEMFLTDGPIDYVRRPPSLAHVRDAYSIYMLGDSMTPRFRQGQLLHVNPYKPPQLGAGVVVTKADDAVLIKEFVRMNGEKLQLRQYNPAGPVDLPLEAIRSVHTIVGLDEP
ncbi:MAG TPA: LexA family transcriptional regulator [Stellaceae bacterium]|nr:LexA family transcriptional regulator [Stellaceae bacterium]